MENNAPNTLLTPQEFSSDEMKKAFNEIVTKDGIINPHADSLETPFVEENEPTEELDEPIQGTPQESFEPSEIVSEPAKRGRPPKKKEPEVDTSGTDFETEYNKLKETYEAKIGLLNSRIQEVSTKYQELKSTAPEKREEAFEAPDNIKEAFELFPELQEAVTYLIDNKVKQVTEKIQPIQEYASKAAQKDLLAPIYVKHPDVQEIVDSGDLNVWANSLPAIERNGAFAIINHGSPEEVISLLDTYKKHKGIISNESSPKPSMGEFSGTSSDSNSPRVPQSKGSVTPTQPSGLRGRSDTDSIVEKVLAALNVPSSKEPVQINNSPDKKEKSFEEAVRELEERKYGKKIW